MPAQAAAALWELEQMQRFGYSLKDLRSEDADLLRLLTIEGLVKGA